jgi:hypothetical protein
MSCDDPFEIDVNAIFWHLREYSERYPTAFNAALDRLGYHLEEISDNASP